MRRLRTRTIAGWLRLALPCLVLGTATLAEPRGTPLPALGWDGPAPEAARGLRTINRLRLEAITGSELTRGLGSRTDDLGRWRGTSIRFIPAPLETEVTRRLTPLWRLGVDDAALAAALDVGYRIVADNGHVDRLSHVDHPEAEIAASIEPLPPTFLDGADGTTAIEGGAVLTLRLDEARLAGTYSGSIEITLHQL